tara:strand:+ start:11 stop:184 length:174 start_codon:yes stop_codon:yes gene_type:complete
MYGRRPADASKPPGAGYYRYFAFKLWHFSFPLSVLWLSALWLSALWDTAPLSPVDIK